MKKKTTATLLAALCLAAVSPAYGTTMVDGVAVPTDLMALARRAVALNSPEMALKRPDNVYTKHPYYNQLLTRFDFKKLNEEAAQLMVRTFTKAEIEALVRFQSSPEGRSIGLKMQGYQELVGAAIQNQLNAAIQGQLMHDNMTSRGATPTPQQAPKPVVPYTPPAAPAAPQGQGGSPIGK